VFDATVGMPWELFGYKFNSTLGIYNLTDKKYSEGSFALSPARNFIFRTTLSF
jgi:outer membrane receptor protein involved in Fe transport